MSDIEAVLLTGGASRRMGLDKASLIVDGEPLAERIARLISSAQVPVSVLGRSALPGHAFLMDAQEFAGPLSALSKFTPTRDFVFVASCDLPGFDPAVIAALYKQIGRSDAAVPDLNGRLQPLCALYRSSAFAVLRELHASGESRIMQWLGRLVLRVVPELPPAWIRNANSPEDLGGIMHPPVGM